MNVLKIFIFFLQKPEKGCMRVHHLNNVNKALQILEQNNVSFKNIFTILKIIFFFFKSYYKLTLKLILGEIGEY